MSSDRIYTSQFWMLCISALFFITSFNLLIPELNDIMRSLNGHKYLGLSIAIFASAALIARPFSGKLVDTIGRKPVILFGASVCVITGILYNFAASMYLFLAIRFIHGFSTGFTPVGNTSYVADISPVHRRGEVMGAMGMIVSLGFPLGMWLGSIISTHFDHTVLFMSSSGFALISITLVSRLPETKSDAQKMKLSLLKVKIDDFFDKRILVPFFIMISTIFSFGAIMIIVYDHALDVGFNEEMKSIFITLNVFTSLFIRFIAGKLSDRIGRRNVMLIGVSLAFCSLITLANSNDQTSYILGAVFYGLASGFNSPTIFAWAIDLADPKRVGRAMSTIFVAVEIGIILGSFLAGIIYNNSIENLSLVYYTATGFLCLAMTVLLFTKNKKPTVQLPPNT